MQRPLMGIEIAGYGIAVPETRISNEQLIEMHGLDSSDAKIQELSGMKYRHIVDPSKNETNTSLSATSGRAALVMAGLEAPFILDSIMLATTSPDLDVPATAPGVQDLLGVTDCYAYDVDADCSGFNIALANAYKNIYTGEERSLVIGTDILSRFVDWNDRSTAILFGDASGAVLLQRTERKEAGLLSYAALTDGSLKDILYCERGGKIQMDGHEVYKKAVEFMVRVSKIALERANIAPSELKLIVPHQANKRIIDLAARRLGLSDDIMVWQGAGDTYANASSATIPIALAASIEDGKVQRGDNILLTGFGAGMTAAASVIRY